MKSQNDFNQKAFALAIRHYQRVFSYTIIIIAIFIGVLNLLIALNFTAINHALFWYFAQFKYAEYIIILIPAIVFGHIVVILFGGLILEYFLSPRCPECARKLINPQQQLCSGICPFCHSRLFHNTEINDIVLPRCNHHLGIKTFIGYSGIIFMVNLFILAFHSKQEHNLEYLYAPTVMILMIQGWGLILFPLFANILDHLPIFIKKKEHCPCCHEIPSEELRRITGNCSNCGSPIDLEWPPPEPEPLADLPDWQEFNQEYRKWEKRSILWVTVPLILLFSICLLSAKSNIVMTIFMISLPLILIFAFILMIYRYRKISKKGSRAMILARFCPYCHNPDIVKKSIWNTPVGFDDAKYLQNFERCRTCRCRLIKRED